MSNTLDAALEYVRRGWRILPIPSGQKRPTMPGWPDFWATPEDVPQVFGHGENIATILGPASGNLTDIDLDCAEAVRLADIYLPGTGAMFGRPAKPRSHRLYIAPRARFETFSDPIAKDTLLELRADGRDGGAHLTLLPPSTTSGERREWHGDVIAPAIVDPKLLRHRCARLAIGVLVARYVSETVARAPLAPGWDHPRLLWECDHELGRRAYEWLQQPAPDAPRRHPKPAAARTPIEVELDELAAVIPNNCDWEEWNRIGLAFFAASGGSPAGLVAFDDFSAKASSKYDPRAVNERWRNYRGSPPSRIGKGSLIHYARQAGWRPEGRDGRSA